MTQLRFLTLLWSYRTVTGISDRQIWDYFVNSRDSNFQYPRVDSLQQLEKRKIIYTFLHHYLHINCQMKFEKKIIFPLAFLQVDFPWRNGNEGTNKLCSDWSLLQNYTVRSKSDLWPTKTTLTVDVWHFTFSKRNPDKLKICGCALTHNAIILEM